MKRNELHNKVHVLLACALACCFSFKFLLPPLIILMVINTISNPSLHQHWKKSEHKIFLLLFIAPYLAYLAAMSYSENQHYGWADLQTKLSMLLFPFLFALNPSSMEQNNSIKKSFLFGINAASISLLIHASSIYFSQRLNHFFYVDFSLFLHPSYFGMAIDLGLVLILFDSNLNLSNALKLGMTLFFVLIIFLLASKLSLISTFLILLAYAIRRMIQLKKYVLGISSILITLAAAALLMLSVPELKSRFQNAIDAIDAKNIDKTNAESNAVRILVWNAAAQVLSEHPATGVGTGDIKDELFKKYEELGYTGALSHKLNAHNQFLQTGIALGYFGLLLFILSYFIPALVAFRKKNILFVLMTIVISLNLLTESMLEAEAGVIFISFTLSFLFFSPNKELLNFEQKNI